MKESKARILVVEDDKDVLYFISFALRNLGYTVLEANSGKEALLIIKNSKISKTATEDIDLVITDLIMPGMNGKELAEKIGKISESIKKGILRSIGNCTVKNSIEHTPKIVVNLN